MVEMTAYTPGTPSWVDVSTPNIEATKAFYGELFGWEATSYPEMGGYTRFSADGKRVAGAMPTMSPEQPIAWSTYISTDDADAIARSVQEHGGQVVVPPMDVESLGRMAAFIDPTGAFFGVWQPGEFIGAERVNEPGSLVWNELDTRDVDAAKSFYTKVFPWTVEGSTEWMWQLDGRPIGGGMAINESFPPDVPSNWLAYFAVTDHDATVAQVQALGGSVKMSGMNTPFGPIAVVADPHGAVFGIIQTTQ